MKNVDGHCHLDLKQFDRDREKVVSRAKQSLDYVINCGLGEKSNLKTLELAQKHPGFVMPALGIAPTHAAELSEQETRKIMQQIEENGDKILAVGEVGVDYHWIKDSFKINKEEKVFETTIRVANSLQKPLIVHSREAEGKTLQILEKARVPVVLHCFSGAEKEVEKAVDNGYMISVPTNVAYSEKTKKVALKTPLENILTETDSPYLSPVRGKRNEPINVSVCVEKIAQTKKMSREEVAKQVRKNFEKTYGK